MNDTHALWFTSALSVDQILAGLRGSGDTAWAIRDSEIFGRYVKGRAPNGMAVTIQPCEDARYLVEVYFPTREGRSLLDDEVKCAAVARLEGLLCSRGLAKTSAPPGP